MDTNNKKIKENERYCVFQMSIRDECRGNISSTNGKENEENLCPFE